MMLCRVLYVLLFHVFIIKGSGIYSIDDGRRIICREADNCPNSAVYTGPKCNCPQAVCCIDSGITKSKCEEYGELVNTTEYGPVTTSRRSANVVSLCRKAAVKLIVGGVKVDAMEYPHMVAIGFGDKKKYMCGGTLISHQHILTAAHCNISRDHGPATWAKLGALELGEADDGDVVQEIAISERILHPRYKPPSKYDDIAVFKLARAVHMSGYVRPACLNIDPDVLAANVTATGWGKLTATASDMSSRLMKVQLSKIADDVCTDTYKYDEGGLSLAKGVISSQMCAGDLAGGKDTCQGDSGGPLQEEMKEPYCMYNVIAVTSFGKSCALARAPAIYTRVHHYIPWIESIVWPK